MSQQPDLSNPRLAFILDSLTAASRIARSVQNSSSVQALEKPDRSPVTVADFSVQALLGRRLEENFPGEPLVAEESSQLLVENPTILDRIRSFLAVLEVGVSEEDILRWIDYGTAEPGASFWSLDPVDGTKGFLRGDQFAVALAWIEDGRVEMAGLGCPQLCEPAGDRKGMVFLAARGQGCWRSALGQTSFTVCRTSERSSLQEARILHSVEKAHTNMDQFAGLLAQIGSGAESVPMDSQAKYAALAAGWGDAVIRLQSRGDYREKIWDQAAGSLVVEEAGGRISDQLGRPLDFTQGKRLERNRGVVASNGTMHDELIAQLQKQF